MQARNVAIVSAVRTPIGEFGKSLKDVPAVQLGALVIKEALSRAGIPQNEVDEVYMGNAIQAGLGQCPARQAAIYAGLPVEIPALTLNRVCASGLTAVNLAAQKIMLGDADIVVAGGMENMSQGPYALRNARWGYKLWDQKLIDLTVWDGLWDVFNDYHMGVTAENLAERSSISRKAQDMFALLSHKKAVKAIEEGMFDDEIVRVPVGDDVFAVDERPRKDTTIEKLSELSPVFKNGGTVTAGNSSGINDGAAALLLMSKGKAKQMGIKSLATIKSFACVGVDPKFMGLGAVPAIKNALRKAHLRLTDIDIVEINEAFAAQSLAVLRELDLDEEKLNLSGGAIALGHPIGATGARILVTLVHLMERMAATYGLAALCVGGGQGVATVVERPD